MTDSWRYIEYPIPESGSVHIYIEQTSGEFRKRCESSIVKTGDDVCDISETELRDFVDSDRIEICPSCLRYCEGLIM